MRAVHEIPPVARATRRAALALLLGLLTCAPACKTIRVIEEERPLADTTLMVTRAGDEMNLSWNSKAGVIYVVLFADRRDSKARWQPLRGAERVPGTGGQITLTDRIPATQTRYYRVQMVPAAR